jgi:hypothetical protein
LASLYIYEISCTCLHPSSRRSYLLKTAACLCMDFCNWPLILAIVCSPSANLNLSRRAMVSSPASADSSFYVWPGLNYSSTVLAALLPNITKSSRELAPSLLAPWTEAQAASPHESIPWTILSWPYASWVSTSVVPTVHYNMGGIPTNWKTEVLTQDA